MAKRELLLGDEALALGALHAGLSGVYAYPGTPSTEITEYIQGHPLTAQRGIHCTWSANEKTAMEEALGMSFAGKRALVCMKHVGMNVAADAFVNSAMTGANGGLVVVAADDPSMHSSQNEQDSRFYGKFALVPTFEPSTQQEAYDMVQAAFDFSEKYRIPVLMRLTTRMAHSRAMVEPREARSENSLAYPARTRQWVLMPGNSRVRYEALLADYARFEEEAAASPFNRYADAEDKSLGIIACGIAYNYLAENYPDGCPHPVLKISQYPLPQELVRRMASECKALLIIEEGQPVVEEALRGILPAPVEIRGEVWEDGSNKIAYGVRRRHILGGHCDGLMNYPFRNALLSFLLGEDAFRFRQAMETLRENYPPFAWRSAMNFLGTHDTPRILTLLGTGGDGKDHDKDWRAAFRMSSGQYALGKARLKLGALVIFAFPGSPMVYYGDEAGMEGFEDPFNRRTYPWGREDGELLEWYTALGKARRALPALRRGELAWTLTRGRVLSFLRTGAEGSVLAAVNAGDRPEPIDLPWPARDWMTGAALEQGEQTLPPMTGWLLTPRPEGA